MLNEFELKKLDLNLLLTFSALMQERSTLGAARRLYLGQSAISMALRRLRENFDDELFIRIGRRMEPTARAEAIYAEIQPALLQIQQTARGTVTLDPASFDFELRIGMTDDIELPLLPQLIETLKATAPNVDLSIYRTPLTHVEEMIEAGKVDMAISYYPMIPKWIKSQSLGKVSFLVLYDPQQLELPQQLTAQQYASYEHLLVSFSGTRKGLLDTSLDQLGLTRRISTVVPSVASVPSLLKQQPLITTLPSYVAKHLAKENGFKLATTPVTPPSVDISLVWHRRRNSDPQHQWARELLRNCFESSLQN